MSQIDNEKKKIVEKANRKILLVSKYVRTVYPKQHSCMIESAYIELYKAGIIIWPLDQAHRS